jgi:hypothetical protein
MEPTQQTHEFNPRYTMWCTATVERPSSAMEECGEPVFSPVHDPAAYLALSPTHDDRLDLAHPFTD